MFQTILFLNGHTVPASDDSSMTYASGKVSLKWLFGSRIIRSWV
jgi:hypothetical protein